MRITKLTTGLAAAAMLGAFAAAPAALAQSPHPMPAPAAKSTGPAPSDSELHHFVDAALEVRKINRQAEGKIQSAKSKADKMKIEKAAESNAEQAVKRHQLTLNRYRQIMVAMRTDTKVRARVQKIVKAETAKKK